MEPKGTLPHLPVTTTCSYPEPDRSGPCPTSQRSFLILSSHLCLGLPSGLFLKGFPTKTLYTPIHLSSPPPHNATCPAHLILLDSINQIIFGERYGSLSSSLCSSLHSPFTSSLSGPNIHLNTLLSNTLSLPSSLHQCEQPSFTPIQNNKQNYGFAYLNLYTFG